MRIYAISKEDTSLIKGLAILTIVLHNFFHWLMPSPAENEFSFEPQRIFDVFHLLAVRPFDFCNTLFSYFGHYGVQVFIFISGFGLTISMLHRQRTWAVFVGERLRKIYPILFTGIIVYFFSYLLLRGELISHHILIQLFYKVLFIHTLLPEEGTELVGPWWFFGLIVQLYLLFPLLYNLIKKIQWKALLLIALVSYSWILFSQYELRALWNVPLLQNAPGHIVEFSLGIWFALNKDKNFHWLWCVGAILLFCLGNFYQCFFPFTFISVTIIFLFAFPFIKQCCNAIPYVSTALIKLGALSMLLFVTHTIFRPSFIQLGDLHDYAPWNLAIAILFFTFSVLLAIGSKSLYEWLTNIFSKISIPERFQSASRTIFVIVVVTFSVYVLVFYAISGLSSFNEDKMEPSLYNENLVISGNAEDDFVHVAHFPIKQETMAVYATVSFDYDGEKLPPFIMSIPGIHWYDMKLRVKSNPDGTKHYESQHMCNKSCIQFMKGHCIKFYFWNDEHLNGKVTNVHIAVTRK